MTPRIFVFLDTKEKIHNPSFNLFSQVQRHLDEDDLLPGDVFVTHPAYGPATDEVVSVLAILDTSPIRFELDLANSKTLGIWQRVKELATGRI